MSVLKAGVAGTGFIGPVHIEGLQRNSGLVKAAAVAATGIEKAKETAERFSIEKAYGSFGELADDQDIDSVHICSPNYLHYEMVKEALAKGKHVVCEKPLAMNRREGEELVELADKEGLRNAVHFNLRYYPLVQNLQRRINAESLGRLTAVRGGFVQDWLLYEDDYNWRLESVKAGETRVVGDLASHWFDMIEFLTGERVREVCSSFSIVHPVRRKPLHSVKTFSSAGSGEFVEYKVDTEDTAAVMFRMSGGIQGTAFFSQVSAGRKCLLDFEINGLDGSAAWNSEEPNHMWYGSRDGFNSVQIKDPSSMESGAERFVSYPGGHQEGFGDTVKQFSREFYSALTEGRKSSCPAFEDGLREIIICEAVLESARKDKWIKIG